MIVYEFVCCGKNVVMFEVCDVFFGEIGCIFGYLINDLDDGFVEIVKKYGEGGVKIVVESYVWVRDRIG